MKSNYHAVSGSSVLPLILLFIFASTSCQTNANANSAFKTSRDEVLLEVYTDLEGMVYPSGKVLDLKLYDSGRVEYDYYPPRQDNERPVSLQRRETSLEKESLESIKKLIIEPGLLEAKSEYPPTAPRFDASITVTVIFKTAGTERRIILRENDSDLYLGKKKGVYPSALVDLLLLVQNINDRLLKQGSG